MVKDPVCSALVDPATARFVIRLEGAAHWFCSQACMEKFEIAEKLHSDHNAKGWVKRRVERLLRGDGA